MSSVTGSSGRGAYGAANAVLDALAWERHRLGLPALAINWGPWAGGGMASPQDLAEYQRIGNRPLDPDAALAALARLRGGGAPQVMVARLDWSRFAPVYESRRPRPLIADVRDSGTVAASTATASAWNSQLAATPPEHRASTLAELLRGEIAAALGFADAAEVRPDRAFAEMGVDSLLAAEFATRLQKRLGVSSVRLVFEFPTINALAAHLMSQLSFEASAGGATQPVTESRSTSPFEGYSPAVEADVVEFQRIAFPDRQADLILDRWKWMFVASAARLGVPPRVWLARDRDRIVAHMGAIPVRLKLGARELTTAWLVDTMVLEEYRTQALGSRLMLQAHDDLPFALSLGQTVEMREIQFRLGWKQVAPLQTAQLLIRPERVLKGKLPAPAAVAAGFGLRASAFVRDLVRSGGRVRSELIDRFGERHDALWRRVADTVTCAVVRDASYLNWKYVDQPGQTFTRVEVLDGDAVRGAAVFTIREADAAYKYRRALLVDVVAPFSDEQSLTATLQGAVQAAADAGADAVECLHVSEPLTRALRQVGFYLRTPQRFLLVDPGPLPENDLRLVMTGKHWLVTQGDSDIDRP
jgi:hypothetical protein